MQNISTWNLIFRLRSLDWNFIKGSALLSVGTALARVLGLAFSLVLAGAFSPKDFGEIQYALTLALMVSIGTMPFGQHVLARFIGKHNDDVDHLPVILSNAWGVLVGLFGLTLLVAIPVLYMIGQPNLGILIVFGGVTLFYIYWGLASGYQAPGRLTVVYLGSNIVQIILVYLLIYILEIHSPLLALVIYGASYLLPIALLQIFRPLYTSFKLTLIRKDVIKSLIRFSLPVWASHAGYLLYASLDIILLEHFSGLEAVGIYRLAGTLAYVFLFVPTGISTLLLPKAANLPQKNYRQIIIQTSALTLTVNGVILIIYLVLVKWFVQSVFGIGYLAGMSTYVILALSAILLGVHALITAVLVGSGRPEIETVSRGVAVVGLAVAGWLLIPVYGPLGAAIASLVGAIAALMTYGATALIKPKKTTKKENSSDYIAQLEKQM